MADKSAKDKLPNEFWTQPTTLLKDPSIQLIYSEVSARLRKELEDVPGAGVIEQMQAERVSALYCHIRQKEAKALEGNSSAFDNDRAYKETLQLWFTVSSELQRAKAMTFDPDEARLQIVQQVLGALEQALENAPAPVAMKVRSELVSLLETG